jgi:serine phosphatase RsbU (regulator of sigma subunit)/anti-sigma regulatory factor (Ser/Thr protein kinase)
MASDVLGIAYLRSRRYWVRLVVVAGIYYVAAILGLRLALVGRSVTPLWPPTGVAVVALLALGRRHWPAIVAAAFAINAPISPNVGAALLIAVGNTLAPVASVRLLELTEMRPNLARVRDVTALVFLGALLAMMISATVGTFALLWSNAITAHRFAGTWSVWWTGDAMGVLIVAPLLWSLRPVSGYGTRRSRLETAAMSMGLAVSCVIALTTTVQLLFVVFPVVASIAWRYGQRGAARANFVVSVVATIVVAHKVGPFSGMSLVAQMVKLQTFNATVAFTALLLAAAVTQREQLAAQEHDVVETLQRSLLPDHIPDEPGLEFATRYIPASRELELGGDWYDVIALAPSRYAFVIGDVAGHGTLAAAIMGKLRTAIRAYAQQALPPGQLLAHVNSLMRDIQPRCTATVWYGEFDADRNAVTFANAGHVPPLLVSLMASSYLEGVHGPPIGAADAVSYAQSTIDLVPGSILMLYTDGLIERRSATIEEGLVALQNRISIPSDGIETLCDLALGPVDTDATEDDVAVLAIRIQSLAGLDLRLCRPAVPASIPEARRALNRWLNANRVAVEDSCDVLLATTEACTNVVSHAYRLGDGTFTMTAKLANDKIAVTVSDNGGWRQSSARKQDGGRGLRLMRGLMNSVQVNTAHGTEIRMERTLSRTTQDE